MPYQAQTWKNRLVDKPGTYSVTNNPDGTITLTPVFKVLGGTPLDAANMQRMDDGIAEAHAHIADTNNPHGMTPAQIGAETPAGAQAKVDGHANRTDNPHGTTAAQVGAIPSAEKGAANGVATLGADSKVPLSQVPQGTNLLFNPSARFGLAGWTANGALPGNWSAIFGKYGEAGYFNFYGSVAANAFESIASTRIPMGPGHTIAVSAEMHTANQTGGRVYFEIACYDAAGEFLGFICTKDATLGLPNWKLYTATSVTPANTASIQINLVVAEGANTTLTAFRRVKIESGNLVTPFTDDASLNTVQYANKIPFMQNQSGGSVVQSGEFNSGSSAGFYNITFPKAFTSAPKVLVSFAGGASTTSSIVVNITAISTTGFSIYVNGGVSGGTPLNKVFWTAIG